MSEYSEQVAVIAWARLNERRYPCLKWLHSCQNGIRVSIGLAVKMKAAGMTAGVSDLFLPFPNRGYHGLYIEMKDGKNKVTAEQEEFIKWVRDCGFRAIVGYGFEETVDRIEQYLSPSQLLQAAQ